MPPAFDFAVWKLREERGKSVPMRSSASPNCNGQWSDQMRISTVREFRDRATGLLRSKTPILVTRRGRLAGIFFPRPEMTLPLELKRELYAMLSSDIALSPFASSAAPLSCA